MTPGWSRRPAAPLGNGTYHGRVHGDLDAMATPSAPPGPSRSPSPRHRRRPLSPRRPRASPRAPHPRPCRRPPSLRGADSGAIGRRQLDGEWQRRPAADHRRPDHPRRRGRLPVEPAQPPTRTPTPTADRPTAVRPPDRVIRDGLGRRRPGSAELVGPRPRARPCGLPARDGRGAQAQRDLHEPAAARRLPGRRRHDGRPVVHLRDRPRRAGGPARPRRLRARCRRPGSATRSVPSASSAGSGSSPRGSPATPATPTSRRSSCGSTAGSAWPSSARSSGRPGTSSIRSRRCTTSVPRSCAGWGSRAGRSPTTRSGSAAGRPRSGSRSSSGSSS